MTVAPSFVKRGVAVDLEGIEVGSAPSVRYDVFVNLSRGQTPRRSGSKYVGTLSLFGVEASTGAHPAHGSMTKRFDITSLARSKGFDPRTVRVTIVPVPLLKPRGSAPELRRDGGVAIQRIRVVATETRR